MKQGWEIKKLGEVCENLDSKRIPITQSKRTKGDIPYYGASGIVDYVSDYIFDEDLLCVSEDGANLLARTYPIAFSISGKTWVNNHAHVLRFKNFSTQKFAELYLNSIKVDDFVSGMAQPKLNQAMLNKIPISLPPLPEQQRIVSILDEAFAAIAKAKANAEQNLKNAKELFESYLQGVFENKGDGWECKELMAVCEQITDGSHFSPKSTNEGEYPYITVRDIDNDLIDFTNCKFINETDYKSLLKNGCKPNTGDLLFSKDGTVGKVSLVDFEKDFVVLSSLAIIKPKKDKLDSVFLKYVLKNPLFLQKAIGMKTGVAIRRIILKNLKQIEISFPKSLIEQRTIVRQLNALGAETQKLEAVYQKKIDDLEELKKSILQKAFAGELTSTASISVSDAKVIPLQKVEGISATDLQAGITAIALQRHSELNKQDAFGHVKAEKIVHLVEYILNVDLERNPVKDAAGPNDFPHAKKVESRAAKAGFYTVAKRASDQDTGYIYTQGSSIESLIKKTQHCLGERSEILSQLLKLIVPMKTQQAEIVATVYAAWNNLILKGGEFTNEDIVTEARENWRDEKLKIPREKFFNAIDWMKKNELLIPKGRGKIVKAK